MHKISLFADDIAKTMFSNPKDAVPVLMQELGNYGEVAGLKINKSKSELMSIGIPSPFKIRQVLKPATKYLGVQITKNQL